MGKYQQKSTFFNPRKKCFRPKPAKRQHELTKLLEVIFDEFGCPIQSTRECHRAIMQVLSTLHQQEASVMVLRVGAGLTLRAIGVILGVTPERVRQIEARALRKLRHPSRLKKLKPYLPWCKAIYIDGVSVGVTVEGIPT